MNRRLYELILIVLLGVLSSNRANAQNEYIPPSPSNISMIKASDNDVNLYSGKTNVNVPIYTVREGSLSVNIRLKYNGGSGIKVQEISGEAGLGWALIAGAVVTRTSNNDLDNPNKGILKGTSNSDLLSALKTRRKADLDVINSTIGGRIIFDADKKPYFMNEQGFKIEEDGIHGQVRRWIICSPGGDKYYFGETEASRERFVSGGTISSLASAWYLSKIISAKGEEIKFEYEKSNKTVQYGYWSMFRNQSYGTKVYNPNTGNWETANGEWINSVYHFTTPSEEIHLSKIITSQSKIHFFYTDRSDVINGKAISEIKVLNIDNALITKFIFETGYFKSADPTPTMRLKLNSIKQQNNKLDDTRLIAAFVYNEAENLPARNSSKIDYWGYYNNNTTDKYFLSEGANREADFEKCKANILTDVRWSNGGTTQYTYELNSYRRNNVTYNGGGLRIASIKEIDENKISKISKYDYTTTVAGKKVSTGLIHNWFDITKGYISSFWWSRKFMEDLDIKSKSEEALPIKKVIDLDGIAIGYSKVTVINPDQSNEEYSFQDYASFPDEVQFYKYTDVLNNAEGVIDLAVVSNDDLYNGLSTVTSNSAQRGLLIRKVIFNGKNVLLKVFQYKYDVAVDKHIAGFSRKLSGVYTSKKLERTEHYIGSLFSERVMSVRLIEAKEDSYFPENTSAGHSITSNYEYKPFPHPFQLTKESQKQADGSELVVTYNYPLDMIFLEEDNSIKDVYYDMVIKNMISPVIEKNITIDNKQISLKKTNYRKNSFGSTFNIYMPKSIETQIGTDPSVIDVVFNNYNINGNPLEVKILNGSSVVTLWGYSGQYPIIEIKNTTYDRVKNILGETLINNLNSASYPDIYLETAIPKLLRELPDAFITSFIYEPLVGMISKTDERNLTEYYRYDGFGRLASIVDDSGDVIKAIHYNVPQLPANTRILNLAYLSKINGSAEALCASTDRNQYYTLSSDKDSPLPIAVGTVLYTIDGNFAPKGYYSRGSGVAYIGGADGKVTTIYQCWDQFREIEW